jgi:hypothetical protein
MTPINYIIISIIAVLICFEGFLFTGSELWYMALKVVTVMTMICTLYVMGTIFYPYGMG